MAAHLRGLTAWLLPGTFCRDDLLTRDGANYEPSVCGGRGDVPRPAALHRLGQSYPAGQLRLPRTSRHWLVAAS